MPQLVAAWKVRGWLLSTMVRVEPVALAVNGPASMSAVSAGHATVSRAGAGVVLHVEKSACRLMIST